MSARECKFSDFLGTAFKYDVVFLRKKSRSPAEMGRGLIR